MSAGVAKRCKMGLLSLVGVSLLVKKRGFRIPFIFFVSTCILLMWNPHEAKSSETVSASHTNLTRNENVVMNTSEVWYYIPSSSRKIFSAFYQQLTNKLPQISILPITLNEARRCDFINKKAHFITSGVNALKAISNCPVSTPVFAFYLTESQYQQVNINNNTVLKNANKFFVDQPLIHQLALASQFLPQKRRVGILYSPSTRTQVKQLKNIFPDQLKLVAKEVNQSKKLIKTLVDLLKTTDYIIAPLDNSLFNARTAKTILLTSYRHQKPLFGNSRGFVKAGIIASCYSTPEILINQLVEKIASSPDISGETFYPDDFEVIQNVEVANSLNLAEFKDDALKKSIKKTLKSWSEKK